MSAKVVDPFWRKNLVIFVLREDLSEENNYCLGL